MVSTPFTPSSRKRGRPSKSSKPGNDRLPKAVQIASISSKKTPPSRGRGRPRKDLQEKDECTYVVESIHGIKINPDTNEKTFLVKWEGYDFNEYNSENWVIAKDMQCDDLVEDFMTKIGGSLDKKKKTKKEDLMNQITMEVQEDEDDDENTGSLPPNQNTSTRSSLLSHVMDLFHR